MEVTGDLRWHVPPNLHLLPKPDPLFNVNSEPESTGPSSEFYKLHISPVLISETF
jgi:hypothetical protein